MTTQDIRPDLAEDHKLWADVLALCNKYNSELKNIMAFLRHAGCNLWLDNDKLCFSFNRENLNEHMVSRAKETIQPHQIILKTIFERIAKKHLHLDPQSWEEEIPF